MQSFILAISSLICLIMCPIFFLLGLITIFEEALLGFLQTFVGAPILLSLSIIFDYVREKLEDPAEEDPDFQKYPSPATGSSKQKTRVPHLGFGGHSLGQTARSSD